MTSDPGGDAGPSLQLKHRSVLETKEFKVTSGIFMLKQTSFFQLFHCF